MPQPEPAPARGRRKKAPDPKGAQRCRRVQMMNPKLGADNATCTNHDKPSRPTQARSRLLRNQRLPASRQRVPLASGGRAGLRQNERRISSGEIFRACAAWVFNGRERRRSARNRIFLGPGFGHRRVELRVDLPGLLVGAGRRGPGFYGLEPAFQMREVVEVLSLLLVSLRRSRDTRPCPRSELSL